MPIALDASTPAAADLTSSTSLTIASASFTPPAGSLVVISAGVELNSGVFTAPAVTVADSLSNSYAAGPSANDSSGTYGGLTYLFSRYYATSPGAITVTATRSAAGTALLDLVPLVLTGAAAVQTGAAAVSHDGTTSTATLTAAITTTTPGSWVIASATVDAAQTTFTPVGLTTWHSESSAPDTGAAMTGYWGPTVTPGAVTLGWDVSAAQYWAWAALEILPAAAVGASVTPAVLTCTASLPAPPVNALAQPYHAAYAAFSTSGLAAWTTDCTTATGAYDGLLVTVSASTNPGITSVTDTRSNTYALASFALSEAGAYTWVYAAAAGFTPLTTADTITATWTAAAGLGAMNGIGVPGAPYPGVAAVASGSTTAASVSAAPSGSGQTAVAVATWALAGGGGTLSGGSPDVFAPVVNAQATGSVYARCSAAAGCTGTQTPSYAITPAPWSMIIVFMAAGSNAAVTATALASAASFGAVTMHAGTTLTRTALTATASLPAPAITSGRPSALTAASFSNAATPALTALAPAPPGVQAGDLLLIWVFGSTQSLTFTSTGWTAVTPATGQNDSAQLLYKTAASADVTLAGSSGSYTVTVSGSTVRSIAGIIADAQGYVFDAGAGTPASSGQLGAATSASVPVTGVTTTGAGDTLLWFAGVRVASGTVPAITPPAGFTTKAAQLNTSAASVNVGAYLATQVQVTAGATGTETGTLSGASDGGGLLVALTPPATGNAAVTATAVACTSALPAPALHAGITVTATALSCSASFPAAVPAGGAAVTAPALTCAASPPVPVLRTDSGVTVPAMAASASLPAPVILTGAAVTVAALAASTSLPAALAVIGAKVTATALARTASFPAAQPSIGTAVPATALACAASFPVPVVPTQYSWMTTGPVLDLLYASNPSVTSELFNTPAAFAIGLASTSTTAAPFTSPLAATPVLSYSSYAQFSSDITAGAITWPYAWVLYDCEYWGGSGQTPAGEYDSPITAMQSFTTLAHAHGYRVILTPGRDLATAPGTIFPYTQGSLDAWYEANNIAGGAAGTGAEIVEVQTQADTLTPANFTSLWAAASAQVAAASGTCRAFAGVSVNYGSGAQMAQAALSIPAAAGYWLNGTAGTTSTSVTAMETWLGNSPVTAATLTVSAAFPAVAVSTGQAVTGSVLTAAAAFPAPAVSTGQTESRGAHAAVVAFPSVTASGGASVTVTAVTSSAAIPVAAAAGGANPVLSAVTSSAAAGAVQVAGGANPAPATLAATSPLPAVTASAGQTAAAVPAAATTAVPAPGVSAGGVVSVAPVSAAAAVTVAVPAVQQDQAVAPAVTVAAATVPAPSLSTGQTSAAATVTSAVTVPAVTVSTDEIAAIGPAAGAVAFAAPVMRADQTATAAVLACAATFPAPAIREDQAVTVTAMAVSTALPGPVLHVGQTASQTPLAATVTVPAAVASGSAAIVQGAITAAVSIPAAVASGNAATAPAAIAVTSSLPAVTVSTGGTDTRGAHALAASLPVPVVTAGSTAAVSVAAVTAGAVIPVPVVRQDQAVAPATVAASVNAAGPQASAGAVVTVTAVAVTVTITPASGNAAVAAVTVTAVLSVPVPQVRQDQAVTVVTITAGATVTASVAAAGGGDGFTGTVVWTAGAAPSRWQAEPTRTRWLAEPAQTRWRTIMTVFQPIAAGSLAEINITWTSELFGTVIDPTGQSSGSALLPVLMAFPVSSGDPLAPATPATWFPAAWLIGSTAAGWTSQCLVGPGGVTMLTAGLAYDVFGMVLGEPEVPMIFAGTQEVLGSAALAALTGADGGSADGGNYPASVIDGGNA